MTNTLRKQQLKRSMRVIPSMLRISAWDYMPALKDWKRFHAHYGSALRYDGENDVAP
jgi:hypothetical protein